MNKTRRNGRLLITKNLIIMLVLLVVISLTVWSWFTINSTVKADSIIVRAKTTDVQIALPYKGSYPGDEVPAADRNAGHKFTDEINFSDSEQAKSSDSDSQNSLLKLYRDTTSDGAIFLNPGFTSKTTLKTGKTVNEEAAYTLAKSNKDVFSNGTEDDDKDFDYISLDFYLRSTDPKIRISDISKLISQSELDGKLLSGDSSRMDADRKSTANDSFSADALIGAMRVSISYASVTGQSYSSTTERYSDRYQNPEDGGEPVTDWDSVSDLSLLWLPRPDVFLQTGDSYSQWELLTGITPSSNLTAAAKSYRHTFFAPEPNNWAKEPKILKELVRKTYYDENLKSDFGLSNDNMESFTQGGAIAPKYFHSSRITGENTIPSLGTNETVCKGGKNKISFTEDGEEQEYYVYKCNLNIWIEGEDAEARRAMNKGTFRLELQFQG